MAFSRSVTAPAAPSGTLVSCPFGKASSSFPLAISRAAALGALSDRGKMLLNTSVVGYSTCKTFDDTFEAGGSAVRVQLASDGISDASLIGVLWGGALAVTVRANGQEGFLVGIAAARSGSSDSEAQELEIVIFGRPDKNWKELTFLPEDVLRMLLPEGTSADVRVISTSSVHHDLPPQWLRDRVLQLADEVNTTWAGALSRTSSDDLQEAVEFAGICPVTVRQTTEVGSPANPGKEECGDWDEEIQDGIQCGILQAAH